MAALLFGFVLGALLLGLELAKASLAPVSIWAWIAGINFLHFAALLFVLSVVILIGVSLATPPPPADRVAGLTRKTQTPAPSDETWARWKGPDMLWSLVLAAVIGVLWIIFR